jgi:CubicO group peptidase (beta-lactamase class C family)
MRRFCLAAAALAAATLPLLASQGGSDARQALIARAKALEIETPYEPPPGDPLAHHAAGFAKIMCSAVFITGLDPAFAAENVGYFTAPYAERAKLGPPRIDRAQRAVHVGLPGGGERVAKHVGSQGCVALPPGATDVSFTPTVVKSALPDAATQPWPMGDRIPDDPLPPGVDRAKVQQAVDAAFEGAGLTAAFVVTWKGRLIAERYGDNISHTTPLESWSMGKSLTATLMGILIQQGAYDCGSPRPSPSGRGATRARRSASPTSFACRAACGSVPPRIRIRSAGPYPDHLYLYTGTVDSFKYAATRPQQWPPNTVGRYRNTDPVLANYLIRLAVEKRNEPYHAFPQRALFDRIGIRTMVMETDPYGNFLTQGYEFASGRDWAGSATCTCRTACGTASGCCRRTSSKFVSTLAPAWEADKRPIYGGFFWLNGTNTFPVPSDAYYMSGAGGQTTLIIPSHDLVVVRLGHYRGSGPGGRALRAALALLMEAVPPSR